MMDEREIVPSMHVIVDLDGTLTDPSHRLHYLSEYPPNWDAFFAAAKDDAPIWRNIQLVKVLRRHGHMIYILSGRSEVVREDTAQWIYDHGLMIDALKLRGEKDRRPDVVVKREQAEDLGLRPEHVLGVLEDRARVVRMWRELGYNVWHVDEGEY